MEESGFKSHLRLLYVEIVRNPPLTGVNRVPVGKHQSQPNKTPIFDH
jgi:hypothetical protein